MKKLIILLLSIWLLQSCKPPQLLNDADPFNAMMRELNIALVAGAGISKIGGPESGPSWEDPIGGQIGVEAKVLDIDKNSSIHTGVNFSLQGAAYEENYLDGMNPYDTYEYIFKSAYAEPDLKGKVTLTYINLPILYNYKTYRGFYGEIGLQPGFLLSAKDKIDGGESYDYKDYVKGFELGLPIGAGYYINEQLSVGARFTWGLTNNSDSGSGDKDHNILFLGLVRYSLGSLNK